MAGETPLPEAVHAIRGAALQLGAAEVCRVMQEEPLDMRRIEAALDRLRAAAIAGDSDQPG